MLHHKQRSSIACIDEEVSLGNGGNNDAEQVVENEILKGRTVNARGCVLIDLDGRIHGFKENKA